MKFDVQTFGCKVNTYDTGLLQQRLMRAGFQMDADLPEVRILNTCAVTAEATKEAIRTVKKIKRDHPSAVVVVTGCAAQVDTEHFTNLQEADLIVANSHKGQLEELIEQHLRGELSERVFRSNIFKKEDLEAGGGEEVSHTRSFLKIQDGCNSFCTFCIIPFARGKSRSVSIDELVKRVNELHNQGVREVVLTGVHIGDYIDESSKGEYRLEDLIETLLRSTEMPRFRLSSLEPPELTPRLVELYQNQRHQNQRLCPHFHMSIQSAQTRVLKDMKRQYDAVAVERALMTIAEKIPGSFVGMDVIAGFPGETDEEFDETYDRLASLPWSRIHVFPYSPRPGTFANRIELQHRREVIMARAQRLRDLSSERYQQQALEQVGKIKRALTLRSGQKALTDDYWTVELLQPQLSGQELQVKVIGYDHAMGSRMEGQMTAEVI